MLDEGYVKFKYHHDTVEWKSPDLPLTQELETKLEALDNLRTELHDAHFIGIYENGIGYGNISLRSKAYSIYSTSNINGKSAPNLAHDINGKSAPNISHNTDITNGTDRIDNTGAISSTKLENSNTFVISATSTGGARELGLNGYCFVSKLDINTNTVWSTGPLPASSETMTHAAIYQSSHEINCVIHIHNRELYDALLKQENALKTPKNIPYGTVEMAHALMEITKKYPLEACIVMAGHDEGIIFYGISIEQVRSQIAFINTQFMHVSCKKCKH